METPQQGSLLLHCCCAPCASGCLERLLATGRKVGLLFANHNIDTAAEFNRRLNAVYFLAKRYDLELTVVERNHDAYLKTVAGLEKEPEGGNRCLRCFALNLSEAAKMAAELNYSNFTTSLTVSPHKDSNLIFSVATPMPGFEPWNFKKQNGFLRSLELSRAFGLYRQNYCGCEFSKHVFSTKKPSC